jgi:6,7-dimethyl-8-ribityllumazine synthase
MAQVIEGNLDGRGRRVAVVVSRFNDFVTSRLRDAAHACLVEHGVDPGDVVEIRVPGAFELPLAARVAAQSGRHDAIVCLGAVIRGGTPHFDYVAGECAAGIERASAETGVPVIFGVHTPDTPEDAVARAGGERGNKGRDAAVAALEMIAVLSGIRGSDGTS